MPRMTNSLKSRYLEWLEPQLRDEHGNPDKSYRDLLTVMFDTPFGWSVPMDDNRLADGLDLRREFSRESRPRPSEHQLDQLGPCTFLEVLIGLSRRMAFNAGGDAPGWAWQLLGNLELHRMSDPLSRPKESKVRGILDTVIQRTYSPDGTGGFFPLAWPDDDQTRIDLWYQMNAYIMELHPEHKT